MNIDLRDYFAGQALQAFISSAPGVKFGESCKENNESYAIVSYLLADAMLKARKPKFEMVRCSQCGSGFGPGDSGFSSCKDHQHLTVVED